MCSDCVTVEADHAKLKRMYAELLMTNHACAALFLASDECSYGAGIYLPIDGGLTAV
jgi:hypothetical protein